MKFGELYSQGSPAISFELFPPKTEPGLTKLRRRLPKMKSLDPAFISVTYGAFGTDQNRTLEIVIELQKLGLQAAHHLTCVGANRSRITEKVARIQAAGIENIVALRGDPPRGSSRFSAPKDGFRYANELVEHLRRLGSFGIAVAGYPEKHLEAPDAETDIWNLKRKVDAGADAVITQLFYDNEDFYRFRDRCAAVGIDRPLVAGLMPILNLEQIQRITQMCGASIPGWLLEKMEKAGAGDELRRIGIEHTVRQACDLLEQGVAGLHFYVLNRYFHIAEIITQLKRSKVLSRVAG